MRDSKFEMRFILALFTLVGLSSSLKPYNDNFYTAAVFEHAVRGNWSTDSPEDIIQANLAFYKTAANVAMSKGTDIIVFPEYGIFPFAQRQELKKVLESVPDPRAVRANPCEEPEEYSNKPILRTLSCIAKNNSIVVVANTGDIQPCANETGCPEDGVFQYNANVAFDADGTLIGRYHKEHLFFEVGMDLPRKQQDPTFVTQFGKFAMFVCFDVVFERIMELAKTDVEAILLPTMWIDPAPFMTSVQLWQAWSMANNVTFMAANIQIPGYQAVGSGIFNGRNGPLIYTYNPDGKSKLVVAIVPKRSHMYERNATEITVITPNGVEKYKNDGDKVPTLCSKKILGQSSDIYTDYRCIEENTSNYTFTKLNETQGHVESCNSGMCCSLDYVASDMQEDYYLGVYNGTYNMYNRYFWCEENCLLVRCDPFGGKPCATFPMRSKTKFQHVHISANVTSEHVYPSVLGSGIRLVPVSDWRYGMHGNKAFVNFVNSQGKELTVVGLNGRCYDRDPPYVR